MSAKPIRIDEEEVKVIDPLVDHVISYKNYKANPNEWIEAEVVTDKPAKKKSITPQSLPEKLAAYNFMIDRHKKNIIAAKKSIAAIESKKKKLEKIMKQLDELS